MEHDSPTLLFRLACEYLISVQVIRPGPVTVLERVAHAREEAQRETYDRLAHEFTEQRCAGLDGLLVVDPEIGTTRLRWLTTGAVEASPAGIRAEVAKLEFLRGLGADTLDLSVLPAERRRFLATVGRRLTAQALERRDPQRRYPILLTLLAQSAVDVLDEVVSLFDQAVSAREGKAERSMRDALAERGKAGEDRQALLDELLAVHRRPGRRRRGRGRPDPGRADRMATDPGGAGAGGTAGSRAITATWRAGRVVLRVLCGSSPRRSWPRWSSPAAPRRPSCSRRWRSCAN